MKKTYSIPFSILFFLIFVTNVFAYSTKFDHGVTYSEPDKIDDGYILFAPINGKTGDNNQNLTYLINMLGEVVHTWETDYSPGLYGFLTEDGTLLFAGKTEELESPPAKGGGGIIQELSWDGKVLWEYKNKFLHHDFRKLPNGNLLAIEWHPVKESIASKILGGIDNTEHDGEIWSDKFIEIDYETKEIVWEWNAEDYLDTNQHTLGPLNYRKEWTHGNSVEFISKEKSFTKKDSVLVSLRDINTVMIIDKASKEIVWEWGQGNLNKQHAPTMLDNGNILVFDNGLHATGIPRSRVVEIDPKTDEIVWEYKGDGLFGNQFFSSLVSNAQRLKNGNTLILEGINGRIFEVTPEQEIVWEYVSPFYSKAMKENTIFKAKKYEIEDINFPDSFVETLNNEEPKNLKYYINNVKDYFKLIFARNSNSTNKNQ